MLRAILFDFNGVLVDDEPLHFRLFERVLGEEGVTLTAADYFGRFLGFDDRGCFTAALADAGRRPSPPELARLIARKASYYQETVRAEGYPYFPGAVELVAEAAAGGLTLGVVSGALRQEIEGALTQVGLRAHFKVLVAAEDVREGKPDPEGYRRALVALNEDPPLPSRLFHPHEVLAIEDSPAGLAAAAQLGLVTLGIAHTYPVQHLERADAVLPELAGAGLARLQQLFAEVSRH